MPSDVRRRGGRRTETGQKKDHFLRVLRLQGNGFGGTESCFAPVEDFGDDDLRCDPDSMLC